MPEMPDFTLADRAVVDWLQAKGHPAALTDDGLGTGVPGLAIKRGETEVLAAEGLPAAYGDVEFLIDLEHPIYGHNRPYDRVSLDAPTPDDLLRLCGLQFCEVTLEPILALFDEQRFAVPDSTFTVNSAAGKVDWNLYAGRQDLRGEPPEALKELLGPRFPLRIFSDSITGCLGRMQMHWCKLYAEFNGQSLQTGCIVDARAPVHAVAELRGHLDRPEFATTPWALRCFAIVVPVLEPGQTAFPAPSGCFLFRR